MSDINKISSSLGSNKAIESIARTDDILALIGIIMIIGVITSAYGSYWQGRYARASYNNQCSSSSNLQIDEKERRQRNIMTIVVIVIMVTIIGLFLYIRSKNKLKQQIN